MSTRYTSDLTPDQFALIEPLLPPAHPGGRPRTTCLHAVFNAILYLVVQGCKWRDLPSDFPAWQTVYTKSARTLSQQSCPNPCRSRLKEFRYGD